MSECCDGLNRWNFIPPHFLIKDEIFESRQRTTTFIVLRRLKKEKPNSNIYLSCDHSTTKSFPTIKIAE